MEAESPIRATSTPVAPSTCPPSSCHGHYPRCWATTGTLSPWALRPLGDPVVVCQVRSTFRVSVHPLPPAHCRVCPAGRSRRRSAHPRETGIRVFSVIPDGGRSHPLGLEFKQSSLTPAWPNSRTSLGPRRWASRRFIRMLLSPQSFRTKVSGSFYPPSSSGVGTLPTRPDKPLPRRTASVRRHRRAQGRSPMLRSIRPKRATASLRND